MENNKQTAVEWLVEQIIKKHPIITQYLPNYNFDKELIEQAKEMERQQDKFTNAPIHDKKAIIEMMNKLHPKEMAEVVEFIKIKIYGNK